MRSLPSDRSLGRLGHCKHALISDETFSLLALAAAVVAAVVRNARGVPSLCVLGGSGLP